MSAIDKATLRVRVNGISRELAPGTTVVEVVGTVTAGVAVARNGEVVPRATWAATRIGDGDEIEIVRAVQGG